MGMTLLSGRPVPSLNSDVTSLAKWRIRKSTQIVVAAFLEAVDLRNYNVVKGFWR